MFEAVEATTENLEEAFGTPDKIEFKPVRIDPKQDIVSIDYNFFFNYEKIAEKEDVGEGGERVREWIEKNCVGNVACYVFIYYDDGHYGHQMKYELDVLAFENGEDATAFKLKWL